MQVARWFWLVAAAWLSGCAAEQCEEGLVADAGVCVPEACAGQAWREGDVDLVVAAWRGDHDTLAAALEAAPADAVIALDVGRWEAPGAVTRSVVLVGRCPEAVVVGEPGIPTLTVDDVSVTVALQRLTVEGGEGVAVTAGTLALEDVVVTGTSGAAITVAGPDAQLSAERSVLTETTDWTRIVPGLAVEAAGRALLDDVEVTRTRGNGVRVVGDGSTLVADGLTILDTFPADPLPENQSVGLHVAEGASAEVTRGDFSGQRLASILVTGASLALVDSTIHDNTLDSQYNHGEGLRALAGAQVAISGLVAERLWDAAIYAAGSSTYVTVQDSSMERIRASGLFGDTRARASAVYLDTRATAEVDRVVVKETYGPAFSVDSGVLVIRDSKVSGVLKSDDTSFTPEGSVWVDWGGELTLQRVTIEDGVETGLVLGGNVGFYTGGYATAILEDVEITGSTDEDGFNGYGIRLQHHARLTMTRTNVHDNFGPGILGYGTDNVEVSITDSVIDHNRNAGIEAFGGTWTLRDTRLSSQVFDEQWGGATGALAWNAAFTLTDVDVVDNEGIGVISLGEESSVVMTRGSITGTRLYNHPAARRQLGWGAVADGGGFLRLDGVRVADNTGIGVASFDRGRAELVDVIVSGTRRSPEYAIGTGVMASSAVEATRLRVTDTAGPGIAVFRGDVTCDACELDGNRYAGAASSYGTVRLRDTEIHGNGVDASEGGGVGVFTASRPDAVVEVDNCVIYDHPYAAAWAIGGAMRISDSSLEGGSGVELRDGITLHGNAVFGLNTTRWNGTTGLLVERSVLHDAAGPAVLLHHGSGTFVDTTLTDNREGPVQQHCGPDNVTPEGLDDAAICPDTDRLVDGLFLNLYLDDIDVESW